MAHCNNDYALALLGATETIPREVGALSNETPRIPTRTGRYGDLRVNHGTLNLLAYNMLVFRPTRNLSIYTVCVVYNIDCLMRNQNGPLFKNAPQRQTDAQTGLDETNSSSGLFSKINHNDEKHTQCRCDNAYSSTACSDHV